MNHHSGYKIQRVQRNSSFNLVPTFEHFDWYNQITSRYKVFSYVLTLLINLSVMDSMLPIYGKTKCHFKVRMCEDLGVSALTRKRVKVHNNSAIK